MDELSIAWPTFGGRKCRQRTHSAIYIYLPCNKQGLPTLLWDLTS